MRNREGETARISLQNALTITAPGQGPNDDGKLDKAFRGANLSLKELPWYVQFSLYLSMLKSKTSSAAASASLDRTPWLESLPTKFDTNSLV
jgi:hypothetical protein